MTDKRTQLAQLYHPDLEPLVDKFFDLAADFDYPGIPLDDVFEFLNEVYDVGRES